MINRNKRPRRNRKNENMRRLVQENHLSTNDLIAPLFVIAGTDQKKAISSMPGQYRYSRDLLLKEVSELVELGIPCVSLFPALDDSIKTKDAKEAMNPDGLFIKTIKDIKNKFPDLLVMTDVAMDPYSSDGHDGYVDDETGEILNDKTLDILALMSLNQAQAGADIIGPSDMMDHRVGIIRQALDENGHTNVSIMSYTAKYCSSFYGPFREALDSFPRGGDKKTYQMDFHNSEEAILEAQLDEAEGADILMVKPGLAYLDVIRRLKDNSTLPIAAYNVSGEYAMIKAAAEKGWLNEDKVVPEMLTSFKRAGADMILTYFAKDMANKLKGKT